MKWIVSIIVILFCQFSLFAAEGVTAPVASPSIWIGLIPVAVPVAIMALKTFIPKLPTRLIPIIAPLIGAAADILLHFAGAATLGPVWGAVLGSAGVGLREIVDQLRKPIGA